MLLFVHSLIKKLPVSLEKSRTSITTYLLIYVFMMLRLETEPHGSNNPTFTVRIAQLGREARFSQELSTSRVQMKTCSIATKGWCGRRKVISLQTWATRAGDTEFNLLRGRVVDSSYSLPSDTYFTLHQVSIQIK